MESGYARFLGASQSGKGGTMSQHSLNPLLRPFWTARTVTDAEGIAHPVRARVLHGGRASSKSWDATGFLVYLAANYKVRVMCTRQFQARISDSVYTLLKDQIGRFGLKDQFAIQKRTITSTTGSEFLFYGLARNIDEVKSTEGVDILYVEEAHSLTKEQWEILEPTIRKEGSQIFICFNPKYITDFVYQRFILNPPPGTLVRQINYDENPFLSRTMHRIIANAAQEDYEEYEHIYLGKPKMDEAGAVIKRSWVEAAIGAVEKIAAKHPELAREMTLGADDLGFDIADGSDEEDAPNDLCSQVHRKGSVAKWLEEWKAGEDELLKSATRVHKKAQQLKARITYDSIGVGASAGAKFDELNQLVPTGTKPIVYRKFNAGAAVFKPEALYACDSQTKVRNDEYFCNLKAQAWWLVADRFRNTYDFLMNGNCNYTADELISIDPDIPHLEKLKTELSTPKRDFDGNGRVKVESKKDLAKRDVASPNNADAFIMAFAPGYEPLKISKGALERAGQRR
jgi:phage terminase large subunit